MGPDTEPDGLDDVSTVMAWGVQLGWVGVSRDWAGGREEARL